MALALPSVSLTRKPTTYHQGTQSKCDSLVHTLHLSKFLHVPILSTCAIKKNEQLCGLRVGYPGRDSNPGQWILGYELPPPCRWNVKEKKGKGKKMSCTMALGEVVTTRKQVGSSPTATSCLFSITVEGRKSTNMLSRDAVNSNFSESG